MFKNKRMRPMILLLVFHVLSVSCGSTPKPSEEAEIPDKNKVYDFRNYKWGTPLSVILEKEGEPNYKRFRTDHLIQPHEYPSDYIYTGNEKIEIYELTYLDTPAAGYKCIMEINFYNNELFSASCFGFYSSTSGMQMPIYQDLLEKMSIIYGDPKIFKSENRYSAEWNNINLRVSRSVYLPDWFVTLNYDSEKRIKMVNEKRQKENAMKTIPEPLDIPPDSM